MKPEENHSMGLFSDGKTEKEIKLKPLLDLDWLPMDSAPTYGDFEVVMLRFEEQTVSVGYWDPYYSKRGSGYDGGFAWIEPLSGDRLDLHYDEPIGWMPIKGEVNNET